MEIRPLFAHDLEAAFPVVAELRAHLDLDEFVRRVEEQQESGYEMLGAFEGARIVGVVGFRPVLTLARGHHMHVDDLVVTEARRRSGIGAALLEAAEAEARRRRMRSVYLDSRPGTGEFYARMGYARTAATLVHKKLAAD